MFKNEKLKEFNLTAMQIKLIVDNINILSKINIKYFDINNSIILDKFYKRCYEVNNQILQEIYKVTGDKNQELINISDEHKELLQEFIKVRFDIANANKFINDHQELLLLVPQIEVNNQEISKLYDDISNKIYTIQSNLDTKKLKQSLENSELTLQEINPLLFLFDN
jgi:uncharacterized secreted protein with C-terminal beta-propeller domain